MGLEEWVYEGFSEEERKKHTYRGGIPVSHDYVFPIRRHITKAFLEKEGQLALDQFNNSPFGVSLGEGGIGKGGSRNHRVTAHGVVRGWTANQEVWNQRLESFGFMPHFNFKTSGLDDPSLISVVGSLFGSEENPAPEEVRADIFYWLKSRGGGRSVMDMVDITGMTFEDYGVAIRLAEYNHYMLDPLGIEMSSGAIGSPQGFANFKHKESDVVIQEIADGLRAATGRASDTWSWICVMRNRIGSRDDIIEDIIQLAEAGTPVREYGRLMKLGITSPQLIRNVLDGVVDVELAQSIQSGYPENRRSA